MSHKEENEEVEELSEEESEKVVGGVIPPRDPNRPWPYGRPTVGWRGGHE